MLAIYVIIACLGLTGQGIKANLNLMILKDYRTRYLANCRHDPVPLYYFLQEYGNLRRALTPAIVFYTNLRVSCAVAATANRADGDLLSNAAFCSSAVPSPGSLISDRGRLVCFGKSSLRGFLISFLHG
jgi:hypothetical protein